MLPQIHPSLLLLRLILVCFPFPEAHPIYNPSHENLVGHILTCLAVQGLGELVNGRRHLQAFVEDGPLALQPDVAWPFHKPGEVTLGLDILSWKTQLLAQGCPKSRAAAREQHRSISDLGGNVSARPLR